MLEIDPVFKNQMLSLSQKADRIGIFTFSSFLSLSEQAALPIIGIHNFTCFGGTDACERKIARFGDPEYLGYEEPYPISCLKIAPKNQNYADKLSHRDFLGAVMNLGVRRDVIGDIFISDNIGYVFCTPLIAQYISDNLIKIKHTYAACTFCDEIPHDLITRTKKIRVNVASERLDAVISSVFGISRSESVKCINSQKVFINDLLCESTSKAININDRITVRGFGKFIYMGISSETKKGCYYIEAELYIN